MKFFSLVVLASIINSSCGIAQRNSSTASKPTFVLVHGALLTGSGWNLLQQQLELRGQKSVSLNVPGRLSDKRNPSEIDLYVAADSVCDVVNSIEGEVILVGHSQGGALITQALNDCNEKVKALVHVAAVTPLQNEIPFQGLNPKVDVGFGKVTTYDDEEKLFRLNKNGPIREVFFADISKEMAAQVISEMVSEPSKIGTTPLTTPNEVIFSIPTYYVEATQDKVISLNSQRKMYNRIPGIKVFSMNTSHSPFLSQPSELADHLVKVANEVNL